MPINQSEKLIWEVFSDFFGLKPNTTKCEIAGIGVLKGFQAVVSGMRCTDFRNEAIKILRTWFLWKTKYKIKEKKIILFHIFKDENEIGIEWKWQWDILH